jgi:hypothetical protein
MKTEKIELNVDYIGGGTSLTESEQTALSMYFQKKKDNKKITNISKIKISKKRILEKA